MKTLKRLVFALAILALAGCFGKVSPKPDESTQNSETATASVDPGPLVVPPVNVSLGERPLSFSLEQCENWVITWTLPQEYIPGNTPPGWESTDPITLDVVVLSGVRCQKIGLGPFERGPINFLLETHTKGNVPSPCTREHPPPEISYSVLQAAYTDDGEVAAYLKAEYGMPISAIEFNETVMDGPVKLRQWTWGPPNQTPSHVTFIQDDVAPQPYDDIYRIFWVNGPELVQLEMEEELTLPFNADRYGQGTIESPMMMADFMDGQFVGSATWRPTYQSNNHFAFYNDLFCEEPSGG